MRDFCNGAKHLVVLAALLGGGSLAILLPVPANGADQAAGPAAPTCARCHASQLAVRNAGSHKAINCETCHGPQAKHAASEGKEKPAKPDVIPLCLNCHEKGDSKPAGRPQVDKAEHYNGTTCSDCHLPHAPKM